MKNLLHIETPLKQAYDQLQAGEHIIPNHQKMYKAFELTPLNAVRVVIMGQDPYPRKEDATGLAFSVPPERPVPPSLKRILLTLKKSGYSHQGNGDLTPWAAQGVLLLNASLTTVEGKSNVHTKLWRPFILKIIEAICIRHKPTIWWLMGKEAQSFKPAIYGPGSIYCTKHPSPQSGKEFITQKHFLTINELLVKNGSKPIDWSL